MAEKKKIGFNKAAAASIKRKRGFVARAIPFKNMFVPEKVDRSRNIFAYGRDNRLPNKLMAWVLDSGTAKKAQAKRASYIAANGFVDKTVGEFKINKEQTANQLLDEISGYQSYFKGFALKVIRNFNQEVVELVCLPFQDIRKTTDGKFVYNPTISAERYDRAKDQTIEPFRAGKWPDEDFKNIIDHGEIIYAYQKSADNPHYPIPDYYAGIEDIRSSSELQKFDYETVMNAFITSAILTIVGDVDDETKDDTGRTEWDYWQEELEKFTGEAKNADGVSGRMRMLIMKARNKEEIPSLQPFDAKVIIDASNAKRDIIDRAVCRLFAVHPVLIGFSDAQILGNTQAIANASNELTNDVQKDQLLISQILKLVFDKKDWLISGFRPIQFVPDKLLDALTETEKRALVNYPELIDATSGEISRVRGTTDSMVAMVTNTMLTREQKINMLKIVYGMTKIDAESLVPASDTPPPNPPAA